MTTRRVTDDILSLNAYKLAWIIYLYIWFLCNLLARLNFDLSLQLAKKIVHLVFVFVGRIILPLNYSDPRSP